MTIAFNNGILFLYPGGGVGRGHTVLTFSIHLSIHVDDGILLGPENVQKCPGCVQTLLWIIAKNKSSLWFG